MEEFADITECSICKDAFEDPQKLQCFHAVCSKCLQEAAPKIDEQQSTSKFNCPICKGEFDLPPEGAEEFQEHFPMIEPQKTTTPKPLDESCEMCLMSKECDEDEVLSADVYCIQCDKNLCRRCSKIHGSIPEVKKHQLISLGTENTEECSNFSLHVDCSRHQKEKKRKYCSDCREMICVVCFVEYHQNHNCSGVDKVGNILRQELKDVGSKVETCLNELLRKTEECIDENMNFQKKVENIEQTVKRRRNELNACIDLLLEQLASMRQTRLKEIQSEVDENERQMVIIENFKAYCKYMETEATNIELCQVVPTLKRRAEEIQQTHRTLCKPSTELSRLDFEQTNSESLPPKENAIEKIADVSDFIRSTGKFDIPSFCYIYGVTKLENRICVLCRQPNAIQIFQDQDSFQLQMEIKLTQIEKPWDIASCEHSKCLYVTGGYNICIWMIAIEDRRVTEWLTDIGMGPGSLSVTNEGHVLVIDYVQPPILKIYNSNADLIRHFPLPSHIRYPQQAIRKANGEFIISHREGTHEGPWVISRLTSDGQTVIGRFSPKDKTQELNKPSQLALDSDNNRLFVVDCGNNRVILLHSGSLDFIKVLLTKEDGLRNRPCGLSYDGKKRQLIIGQCPNKIDVFEFVNKDYFVGGK